MEYKKLLKNIDTYEMALLDSNLSQSNFSIFMDKLNVSRNRLFYTLADEASKKDKTKQVLIDETIQYLSFSTCLMFMVPTDAQFNNCLKHLSAAYRNIQEFDNEDKVYCCILKQIQNLITKLRSSCTEQIAYKTNQLYILQNKIINDHKKFECNPECVIED